MEGAGESKSLRVFPPIAELKDAPDFWLICWSRLAVQEPRVTMSGRLVINLQGPDNCSSFGLAQCEEKRVLVRLIR